MKVTDLNEFKGNFKTAIQTWSEGKIDSLFPSKPNTKVILKNGLNNLMQKYDSKLNSLIDNGFILVGKDGTIDTDTSIELLVGVFEEMEVQDYKLGIIPVSVGKGEIIARLPTNPLLDAVVGDLGKLRITSEDILEIKEILNI